LSNKPRQEGGSDTQCVHAPLTVSVIVPALNAERSLPAVLRAIRASDREIIEIIVSDDGSTDATARVAGDAGATVVRNAGSPEGPGAARNRAVKCARGDIVAFVDADVIVHPAALGRLVNEIAAADDIWAAFGSYDDSPPGNNLAARYANLRHHFVHHNGRPEAGTFWAGIGAFRRERFIALGGFDGRFGPPSIEDVELGIRAKAAGGRIRLVPSAQGAHLKDWTIRQLWRTDILCRAMPWTRMVVRRKSIGNDLNLAGRERWSAVFAYLSLFTLLAIPFWSWAAAGLLASLAVYGWLNRGILRLMHRRGGVPLLLTGLGLHLAYHMYSSATFALVSIACALIPRVAAPLPMDHQLRKS
jgi:glycosyltransferase involved in cell wall biosynthesis